MPNKNKKNKTKTTKEQQPKTTKGNKATSNNQLVGPMQKIPKDNFTKRICGLTDPFCDHAIGAKYPDSSSVKTLAYSQRMSLPLVTDANGTQAFLFSPQYLYMPQTQAFTRTGSSVTVWSQWNNNAPISGVETYRIVSAGFVLRRISAPLNSSGMVSIRTYGVDSLLNMGAVDTLTYNATRTIDIPLQDCEEFVYVYERTAQRPESFYEAADDQLAITSTACKGFCPVTIYVTGAPVSQTVLQIYHVVHYELVFTDSTGLAQLANPPPPANSALTSIVKNVQSTIEPYAKQGIKAFSSYLARKAGAAATKLFLPGPAAALAMVVD